MAGDSNTLDEEKLRQALAVAAELAEGTGATAPRETSEPWHPGGTKKTSEAWHSNGTKETSEARHPDGTKETSEPWHPDGTKKTSEPLSDLEDIKPYIVSDGHISRGRKRKKRFFWAFIFVISFILFATGIFFVCKYILQDIKNKKNMEEIYSTTEWTYEYDGDSVPASEEGEKVKIPINFDEIKKDAENVFAWIYVSGTNIDYPVVMHPEDDTYYLSHDIYGEKNVNGAIFLQRNSSREFDDFDTIIYGHNMKNGSMFRDLHKFEEKDFFQNNRYIYIFTPDMVYIYQTFAAYRYDDTYIPGKYDFMNEDGRRGYLDDIKSCAENGIYEDDVDVRTDSRILTLSTCAGDGGERFLLQAVLIQKYDAKYQN